MTEAKFWSLLGLTGGWYFNAAGQVRRRNQMKGNGEECPVCALHPSLKLDERQAGKELGLKAGFVDRVALAADHTKKTATRKKLLRVVGLADESGF